uniref:Proteasome subunit beta n=1 Tax=Oryza brachyantha TaxID=4533 RepID=J3M960_ORYBR
MAGMRSPPPPPPPPPLWLRPLTSSGVLSGGACRASVDIAGAAATRLSGGHSTHTREHTLYPHVTGTSVIALKYKDGVIMACDTGASYGSNLQYKSVERIKVVGKHSLIGASGEFSDFQEVLRCLDELTFFDHMCDDGNSLGPKEIHSYLTSVMYSRRSKFDPLWNSLVIGGVKKGPNGEEKYLGTVNLIGTHYEENHIATGFGNQLTVPILRAEWHDNMTFEEAVRLVEKCLLVLLYRDRSFINKFQIAKITAEGATIYQPYSLKTHWGFSAFENPSKHSIKESMRLLFL